MHFEQSRITAEQNSTAFLEKQLESAEKIRYILRKRKGGERFVMEILYRPDEIAGRIAAMGAEITEFYRGKELTLVTLMTGGLCFAADLARALPLPLWIDSLSVASYRECRSSGKLEFRSTPKLDPGGREILILDEVLDSGITLKGVLDYFRKRGAAGIRTAVMLEKACPRPNGLAHADWAGFVTGTRYLVGYGLDADERYRNLPYIAALD